MSMLKPVLSHLAILFSASVALAQRSNPLSKYERLKKWVGESPTFDKRSGNFFMLPEIARTLRKLLNKEDYYYLTKGHTKEGLIPRRIRMSR